MLFANHQYSRALPRCRAPRWSACEATGRVATTLLCVLLVCIGGAQFVGSQTLPTTRPADAHNGERLYKRGCIACHGSEGRGAAPSSTAFERPGTFPDFTACAQTTPEPDAAWKAIITHGGPSRGFSQIMPAFGDYLSSENIDDLIAYLRGFCSSPRWARGELNLPRAIVTEKAFPEDEVVISNAVNATGAPGFVTDIIHEQRIGKHNQIEVDLPINAANQNHSWEGGIGDITFGLKREIFSSLRTGSILSLQAGILPPSGDSKRGFGAGTTTFEPFLAFDQLLPANTFVQFQMGADLPRDTKVAPQSLFYRTAIGHTFAADHMLGRMWSPMVEFLADRDLEDQAKTNWDVLPQMQVTLSRRQHVRANIGVRTPFTNTHGRTPEVTFYILWDWADGKLWDGWR